MTNQTSEVLRRVDEIEASCVMDKAGCTTMMERHRQYIFDQLRTALKDTEHLDWLLSQLRTWPGPAASLHVEAWLGGVSGAAQRRLTRKDLERAICAMSPTTGPSNA